MLDGTPTDVMREADAPAISGTHRRPTMISRIAGAQPNGTMMLVLMLFGVGGTGAGVSSLFGPSEAAVAELRRDIEDNKKGVAKNTVAMSETEKVMLIRTVEQQRWVLDELIKIARNIGKMSTALDLDLDTRVSPKLPVVQ